MRISDWSSDVCSSDLTITGQSRAEVGRALRTGEDLAALDLAADADSPGAGGSGACGADAATDAPEPGADGADSPAPPMSWHALLGDALVAGTLTSAQYSALRVGPGEPPVERYPALAPEFLPRAWRAAVEMLLGQG